MSASFSTKNYFQDYWSDYALGAFLASGFGADLLLEAGSGKVYHSYPGAVTVYEGMTNRLRASVIQQKTIADFGPQTQGITPQNTVVFGTPATSAVKSGGGFLVAMNFLDNSRTVTGPFYLASHNVGNGNYFYSTPSGSAVSISLYPSSPYEMASVRVAARAIDNLSDYAFDVTVTATTTVAADFYINTSAQGQIGYGPRKTTGVSDALAYSYAKFPVAQIVVTQFSDFVLQRSAQSILAGGDGSVALRGQMQAVITTVSTSWNPHPSGVTAASVNFWHTTTTLMSRHFPITFVPAVSRPAYYGA